jgi:hypothetical protein
LRIASRIYFGASCRAPVAVGILRKKDGRPASARCPDIALSMRPAAPRSGAGADRRGGWNPHDRGHSGDFSTFYAKNYTGKSGAVRYFAAGKFLIPI